MTLTRSVVRLALSRAEHAATYLLRTRTCLSKSLGFCRRALRPFAPGRLDDSRFAAHCFFKLAASVHVAGSVAARSQRNLLNDETVGSVMRMSATTSLSTSF